MALRDKGALLCPFVPLYAFRHLSFPLIGGWNLSLSPIGLQVENFGMHLRVDGTIIYGIFMDAVLDRLSDDISLDHLAR